MSLYKREDLKAAYTAGRRAALAMERREADMSEAQRAAHRRGFKSVPMPFQRMPEYNWRKDEGLED
jgi:hypothetical protein